MAKLESQTEEACENLRDVDLIDDNQEALDDCVSRGLYTVEVGTSACVQSYLAFEACIADLGCGDLEELYGSGDDKMECRAEARAVQQECNVNVL